MSVSLNEFLEHYGVTADADTLKHYGVKGMKWKETKDDSELSKEERIAKLKEVALGGGPRPILGSGNVMVQARNKLIAKKVAALNPAEKANLNRALKNGAKLGFKNGQVGYEYHGADRHQRAMADMKAGYHASITNDIPFVDAKINKKRVTDRDLGA